MRDETVLEKFSQDADNILKPLQKWTNKVNMFKVLKLHRTEIRHSNMLAWLFNPKENHGLQENVVKDFIKYMLENYINEELHSLLIDKVDWEDLTVVREKQANIDLLLYSKSGNFVICIENKTYSKEHDNQLNKYRDYTEKRYKEAIKVYVYLTIEGQDSSDTKNWLSISYGDIYSVIKKNINNCKNDAAKHIIKDYLEVLEDMLGMEDKEIKTICGKIYKTHQKELDLLFEYYKDELSNEQSDLANCCKKWAKEKDLIESNYGKKEIRIQSKELCSHFKIQGNQKKIRCDYLIELPQNEKILFKLLFTDETKNSECREKMESVYEKFAQRKLSKKDWQYLTVKTFAIDNVDITEEEIKSELDKIWAQLKEVEQEILNSSIEN